MTTGSIVTVFGSASPAPDDPDYRFAYELGTALADAGLVVCNGGRGGTMEASARGAKESPHSPLPPDKRTIGVIATGLGHREANRWIDTVITVHSLVDRLLRLISLGEAFVVLPGGTGTLLELATVWEFMNKGLMEEKPVVAVGSFWNDVVASVARQLGTEGRVSAAHIVRLAADAATCVEEIRRT